MSIYATNKCCKHLLVAFFNAQSSFQVRLFYFFCPALSPYFESLRPAVEEPHGMMQNIWQKDLSRPSSIFDHIENKLYA